jgi:hypothetical protein
MVWYLVMHRGNFTFVPFPVLFPQDWERMCILVTITQINMVLKYANIFGVSFSVVSIERILLNICLSFK